MYPESRAGRTQRGNILFLILLAVVLFAALSYAVTQGMRGGGNDASPEKAKAYASDLIGYATLIENTVQRMMLIGNVDFNELDFTNRFSNWGRNTNCGLNTCGVFNPAGGNVADRDTPDGARYPNSRVQPFYFALSQLREIGTNLDDLLIVFFDLNEETCKQINNILGVPNSNDGLPPNDALAPQTGWVDNMANPLEQTVDAFSDSNLIGKSAFCSRQNFSLTPSKTTQGEPSYGVSQGNVPMYYYIHVLVTR